MNALELITRLGLQPPPGLGGAAVARVVYDSRKAGPGDLYAALPGTRTDGHAFLEQVAAAGAPLALVSQAWLEARTSPPPLPCLAVPDTREAMARVACELAGHPSRQLPVVAVTGTNGKTTTAHLIQGVMARASGLPAGIVGTLGASFGDVKRDTGHTTPQAPELQTLLAEMANAGAYGVAMEASSHAIDQKRVYGCAFKVAVFTNLTQDHLDYHGTMAAYAHVKQQLFNWRATGIPPGHAVVNLDDPWGERFRAASSGRVITYGIDAGPAALLWADQIASGPAGSRFVAHWEGRPYPVALALPGRFNVANALAAFATGLALGYSPDLVAAALAGVPGVPGRAEVVTPGGHPFTVWVDYAHTPDGLENVLKAARALGPRRLVVVFGCGGDRDKGKRPLMGAVASRLADHAIVTSDNPRSEDPEAIAREVTAGMTAGHRVVRDRELAIAEALAGAGAGDLVVIAGKGHETTQAFADRVVPFDDRAVARAVIARLGAPC